MSIDFQDIMECNKITKNEGIECSRAFAIGAIENKEIVKTRIYKGEKYKISKEVKTKEYKELASLINSKHWKKLYEVIDIHTHPYKSNVIPSNADMIFLLGETIHNKQWNAKTSMLISDGIHLGIYKIKEEWCKNTHTLELLKERTITNKDIIWYKNNENLIKYLSKLCDIKIINLNTKTTVNFSDHVYHHSHLSKYF